MGHLASTRSFRPILLYAFMLNHASSHHSCHLCEDVPEAEVLQENGGIARRPSFDASSMGVVQPDCSNATKCRRVTTEAVDHIRQILEDNPFLTPAEIVSNILNLTLSDSTIRWIRLENFKDSFDCSICRFLRFSSPS